MPPKKELLPWYCVYCQKEFEYQQGLWEHTCPKAVRLKERRGRAQIKRVEEE